MEMGPEPRPAQPRPAAGRFALLGVWAGTFAAGLVTTAVATAGYLRLAYPTWPDKDVSVVRPLAVVAIGLGVSVAGASVVTALAGWRGPRPHRLGCWTGAWVVALAAGAFGLKGFADHRDQANRARTTADLVGTWEVRSPTDDTPTRVTTFHPDGTYETVWVADPMRERATDRGVYLVSADGRLIEFVDHNSAPAEPAHWDWNLQFTDRDHFRVWSRVWRYTATDVYVRKE